MSTVANGEGLSHDGRKLSTELCLGFPKSHENSGTEDALDPNASSLVYKVGSVPHDMCLQSEMKAMYLTDGCPEDEHPSQASVM